MAINYKGFSTVNRTKKFRLVDFELVKQDLINTFSIRKGEKLMQPNLGTIIWNVIFEPFTEDLQQAIVDDIKRIVNADPRIQLRNMVIDELEQGLKISLELYYVPTNQQESLEMTFDKNSSTLTTGGSY